MHEGWLTPARRVPSPNQDQRPLCDIDLVVVHGISLPPREYGGNGIDALFTNTLDAQAHPYFQEIAGLRVSAHLLIRRDGELVQYVPFEQRAWHAGKSAFEGRCACNDYSIGIELEGCDEEPYEEAQYQCLAGVLDYLMQCYRGITPARIVGHSDIAPGRKTDPGPLFDWGRLYTLLTFAQGKRGSR
ncbi:MAG: 1,6-anhydro-N-acetylmuramyl-L-alanine amidase AmpD [Chromatiales bacterium]|nr:1,6-anhydro-N-acetylmuramyl-L-alanine amidase AmpD [Chromatiales bacterium]